MVVNPITSAFAEASAALGFSFEPSFEAALRSGAVVRSLGLVRRFGSEIGTLIFSEAQQPTAKEVDELRAEGYFSSVLFESSHSFVPLHFQETLNAWGFYGETRERPTWYSVGR